MEKMAVRQERPLSGLILCVGVGFAAWAMGEYIPTVGKLVGGTWCLPS